MLVLKNNYGEGCIHPHAWCSLDQWMYNNHWVIKLEFRDDRDTINDKVLGAHRDRVQVVRPTKEPRPVSIPSIPSDPDDTRLPIKQEQGAVEEATVSKDYSPDDPITFIKVVHTPSKRRYR